MGGSTVYPWHMGAGQITQTHYAQSLLKKANKLLKTTVHCLRSFRHMYYTSTMHKH